MTSCLEIRRCFLWPSVWLLRKRRRRGENWKFLVLHVCCLWSESGTSYRVTFLSFFYIRGLSGRYFKLEFLLLMQEIIFFGFLHFRFDQRGFCLLYKKEKKRGSLFVNCLGAWIETFILVTGNFYKTCSKSYVFNSLNLFYDWLRDNFK